MFCLLKDKIQVIFPVNVDKDLVHRRQGLFSSPNYTIDTTKHNCNNYLLKKYILSIVITVAKINRNI